MRSNTIHLGHPLILSYKNRSAAYSFLRSKFLAKMSTLKAHKLNHAARLVYIKSVLASIPIYYMSNILFPQCFLQDLEAIIRRFWWAGTPEEHSGSALCYRSWEDVCQTKDRGGLGSRSLSMVNTSLVLHSAWMVLTAKDPFLTQVLKAKYFSSTSFWKAPANGARSVFWSSVQAVRPILSTNVQFQIGNGMVNIWTDLGLQIGAQFTITSIFLYLICRLQILFMICGDLGPNNGTSTVSITSSLLKWLPILKIFLFLLLMKRTS